MFFSFLKKAPNSRIEGFPQRLFPFVNQSVHHISTIRNTGLICNPLLSHTLFKIAGINDNQVNEIIKCPTQKLKSQRGICRRSFNTSLISFPFKLIIYATCVTPFDLLPIQTIRRSAISLTHLSVFFFSTCFSFGPRSHYFGNSEATTCL